MSSDSSNQPSPATPDMIRAGRIFFYAEQLGGLLYRRFASGVENPDVAHALDGFGSDEYRHADWYLEWLLERGASPPQLEGLSSRIVPIVNGLGAFRSLERQLETFSRGEQIAAAHLRKLVVKIHDPSLRAIVERTIPAEQGHAAWFPGAGHRMLRASDREGRSFFDPRRTASATRA